MPSAPSPSTSTSWVPTRKGRKERKMPKIAAALVTGTFALCLLSPVVADPKPAVRLPRILITLRVFEVPDNVPIPASGPVPVSISGPLTASSIYTGILQNAQGEITEVSVQAPADFSGAAFYNRMLPFPVQEQGKATQIFVPLPTSLEATPHVNKDGTITVRLKMEVTRPAPTVTGAVPQTTSQSMQTTLTLKNGDTRIFATTVQNTQTDKPSQPSSKVILQFVTVTILPDEKTVAK